MIEISNVTKRYYALKALDNISLSIPQGEVVGLLGPNGAGKTTLFKLVAGLLMPDTGKIRPRTGNWPSIGYKPERLLFPNHLRVEEYLQTVAGINNIPRSEVKQAVAYSLQQVGLEEAARKKIKACSKGMRQRLGLAQALIGDPQLLLLDEPSNGLDPTGQEDIHGRIQQLHAAGKTIIISSHQLQEVTHVCTQLVILNHGQIHYQASMRQALSSTDRVLIEVNRPLTPIAPFLRQLHPDVGVDGTELVLGKKAMGLRRQVLITLLRSGYDIIRVDQASRTLAEIYAEAVE